MHLHLGLQRKFPKSRLAVQRRLLLLQRHAPMLLQPLRQMLAPAPPFGSTKCC